MKIKKLVLYATTISLLIGGFHMRLSKDAKNYNDNINAIVETISDDQFNITAHRGFSSTNVENTIESIYYACEKDYVDTLEVDARMTGDGRIVLSHNDKLNTSITDKVTISDTPYDELMTTTFRYYRNIFRNIDFSSPDWPFVYERNKALWNREYHLIGLREGIETCGGKEVLLDLKFKDDYRIFTQELIKELDGIDTSNIIFQGFNTEAMRYLRDNSNFNVQILIDNKPKIEQTMDFDRVGIRYDLITYDLIDKYLRDGKKVAVWTINNEKELKYVVGIAGDHYQDITYISDYPDMLAARLNEYNIAKQAEKPKVRTLKR